MNTKEFVSKNLGKDKFSGRPIRLNRVSLKPRANKDYAELLFWGDVHLGYPTSNIGKAKRMLEYALDKKVYVMGMGDYMDAGLRDSVGDSVYRQNLNPQKQMEEVEKMLKPIADEGLLVGLISGNHEFRITKSTSIDIVKIIAKSLHVPYLKSAGWSLFSVAGTRYSCYAFHGHSGSRFKHTKLKAVVDTCGWIESDIIAMGHVHSIAVEPIIKQRFDPAKNKIIEKTQMVILTGAYLEWDDSYGQSANYPIPKIGSPKVKLFAGDKKINISL